MIKVDEAACGHGFKCEGCHEPAEVRRDFIHDSGGIVATDYLCCSCLEMKDKIQSISTQGDH